MSNDVKPSDTPSPDEVAALPEPESTEKERSAELSAGLGSSRKPAIISAVVVLVFLAILIALGVLLFRNPEATARLRDIFIIFLGIQTMIIGLLIVVILVAVLYVALKIYDLTQFVDNELRPILQRADDAIRTVHSRTVFISDTAVKPVVDVMGYTAAVKSILKSFTRRRD